MQAMIDEVSDLYTTWCGKAPTEVDVLPQSGSDRRYFRMHNDECQSVIATLGPNIPENETFIYFTDHFRDKELNVPKVLAVNEDIIQGYKLGADDYITKPFDSEVLLHKIKAILKRNEELNKEADNKEFDLASYHFNPKLRQLIVGGKTQTLSPKENELLKMLCEHLNDLLPREQALKRIWGSDTYFNGRSMDVYIAKLRKYLREDSNIEIVNIHGNGFRLVVQGQP